MGKRKMGKALLFFSPAPYQLLLTKSTSFFPAFPYGPRLLDIFTNSLLEALKPSIGHTVNIHGQEQSQTP